jgi:CubicO group peptidase (beta-lactamase class C family)
MRASSIIDGNGDIEVSGFPGRVPWWSFSKTVLAIAALRLVDRGVLTLDARLEGKRFSLRHLLRHESGLPDYGALRAYHAAVAEGQAPWPLERLLAEVEADRLRFEPGTGWSYSNIGYLEVGRLIKSRSGLPQLDDALRELVFTPAGVETARLATRPADLADVPSHGDDDYHPGWVYHGLVVGTAADAARVLWHLHTGRLLAPETLVQMMSSRALPQHRDVHPDPAYALGLMVWAEQPALHPVGHSGEGPGSAIAVYARGGRATAVWVSPSSRADAEEVAFRNL